MDSSVSPKDEIWFLRVCHHISNPVYQSVLQAAKNMSGLSVETVARERTCHFFLGGGGIEFSTFISLIKKG
jgi:hypothetical protein